MQEYNIVRFYREHPREIIEEGVTLEEAQAHCNDDETSSRTATSPEAVALTAEMGDWFDGYEAVN